MEGIKIVAFAFFLWGMQLNTVQCESCDNIVYVTSGHFGFGPFSVGGCYAFLVPSSYFIHIKILRIESQYICEEDSVRFNISGVSDVYKWCSSDSNKNPVIAFSNVTVTYDIKPKSGLKSYWLMYFTVKTSECLNPNSFQCDYESCIPEEKVCDGVKDCKNGKDETGCKTGVLTIKEVPEVRKNAISWLKQKRTAVLGWREDTPRAVVALYLASAASFNGTVLEEELMAKQTEFVTAATLLRSSLTNSELSLLINALLVTCHSPRQFYGDNLVKRLKEQVEESGNFTHPLAYLALCNANESWPLKAVTDLSSILRSNAEYPFAKDLQAMALLALSCEANRSRSVGSGLKNTILTLYKNTIQHFKKIQADDGSFGNVYTTALMTQALFSSGQEHSRDWNLNATIKYLIKELNSSSIDLLATYLALPILNRKSLMDISYINCSANPRKTRKDFLKKITNDDDDEEPEILLQYSLYIGDEKPVVHTIPLRVPENSTASQVMELAAVGRKYKFEWKMTSGKMYVYKIANVKNDPESGKFWLLYVGVANSSEPLKHLTKGPDEVIMRDGEHLVLWYRTATI